ncbi:MAG: glycosyltransferase family 2 protein [Candidatus Omnitrophota bacterium]|mgnify:CR=1 FL=1
MSVNDSQKPFVTVIIPCRDEEKYIAQCLDSVLAQNYPPDRMEILIADGMSTDRTRHILEEYAAKDSRVRWFDNPRKIVSTGLNLLLNHLKGERVVLMGVHAEYDKNFILYSVKYLEEFSMDVVGGVCMTLPGGKTLSAKAIARALSCSFGIGNSLFRTGIKTPTRVDTVPFGCYRRDVFDRFGSFDEELVRSQDYEFNARLAKKGGKILLIPSIISKYYARDSFSKLWRMYYQYGYFKPLTTLKLGRVTAWRHVVPALFVGSFAVFGFASLFHPFFKWLWWAELLVYLTVNFAVSLRLAISGEISMFPYLIIAFGVIHFSYGIGYLNGILDFVFLKKHKKSKILDMTTSR